MNEEVQKLKGIEKGKVTLFRVTYQHQGKLIQIADYKANIIISITTMIISGVIAITGYGAVTNKLGSYGSKLAIPLGLIVITCLISLVFAIQATRPKLITNKHSETTGRRSSMLFFGVIARYTQPVYLEKMKSLLNSEDDMYEQMIIDFHNQGVILKRKYNLLVYSYQTMMIGFILSVLIFFGLFVFGF